MTDADYALIRMLAAQDGIDANAMTAANIRKYYAQVLFEKKAAEQLSRERFAAWSESR